MLGGTEIFLRFYYASNPEDILYSRSYESGKGIANGSDYNFHLNSKGYKDTEFGEKKRDSFRILALGDSFTFGNVPYSKSYISLLEQKLNVTDPKLEIVNLGLPGIGFREYLAILAREGLALHPDMLLLSIFIGDDILQSTARKYYTYYYLLSWVNTYLKEGRQYPGRAYHPAGDYCDTCQVLTEKEVVAIEKKGLFLYQKGNKQLAEHLQHSKYYLGKILELCQRHNIRPVIVLLPSVMQINPSLRKRVLTASGEANATGTEWQWEQPNELLRNLLLQSNVQYIDLLQPFIEQRAHKLYRKGDIHWNIAGHALAAKVVATALQSDEPEKQ